MTRFWMIWAENGRAPTHRHATKHKVHAEAERLARLNPGTKFFVLEAVEMVALNDLNWSRLTEDEEIPF